MVEKILFGGRRICAGCCISCCILSLYVQRKRIIQIKLRHIHTGIDLPVLRIHKQNGNPLCLLLLHHLQSRLLHIFLDADVQAGAEGISCNRLFSPFSCPVQLHASGICNCEDFSRLSCKDLIIFHFQTNDSLIISPSEPQNLGSQRTVRIVSSVILIHFHPIQRVFTNSIPDAFVYICFNFFNRRNFLDFFAYCLFIHGQLTGQNLDHFFRIFDLAVDHGNRTDSPVICQNISLSIQDLASGCLDIALSLMEIICLLCVIICLRSHKIDQSSCKSDQKQRAACKNHPDLFSVKNHCPDHKKIPLRDRHCNI